MTGKMIWAGRTSAKSGPAVAVNARRHERHPTDVVTCALGEIIDLSASGVRLVCRGKPPLERGSSAAITLRFGDQRMPLVAQARWVRRRGVFRGGLRGEYEVGMRFLQLTTAKQKALESIGRFGFIASHVEARESRRVEPPAPPTMTIDLPNHYRVLGLAPGAGDGEIKAAFRRLARLYHPDTTTDPGGAHKFQEVKQAYAILADVARRRSYDRLRVGR